MARQGDQISGLVHIRTGQTHANKSVIRSVPDQILQIHLALSQPTNLLCKLLAVQINFTDSQILMIYVKVNITRWVKVVGPS